jgi:hypothetical protein
VRQASHKSTVPAPLALLASADGLGMAKQLTGRAGDLWLVLAVGGTGIECPSTLNVLKDTYDHSCYWALSDEWQHLMAGSPHG